MGSIVLFSLVLFVMGGVTAYMGDRLGSYIGKKRHSSFGLRPRHTAMLWTVVSGGGIAVGTLLLLLLWDSTVKIALMQGPQLVAAKSLLEQQNRVLTRRNDVMEARANTDAQKAAAASAQASRAENSLQLTLQSLTASKSALGVSRNVLAQRQTQLAAAQAGLGSTRHDLFDAQARVREAKQGVAAAQRQLGSATDQVARAQSVVLQLAVEQDRLRERSALLAQQNTQQQSQLVSSQGQKVIYRKGEEVGRTVVAASQPVDSIRRELTVFLDDVSKEALRRGAVRSAITPAILVAGPPSSGESGNKGATLDILSQNIAAQAASAPSVVVIANAHVNTFGGEQVVLDLHPYDNVLVFAKGAQIASEGIDGTLPEDVILKRLEQFLTGRVRAAALHDGIIPVHDPLSGEPLVGQPIDSATWVALVKQIQQTGPEARVTAVAAGDTYSGDLLHLELRAAPEPIPNPPPPAGNAVTLPLAPSNGATAPDGGTGTAND